MKVSEQKIREIIGNLLIRDKYKFLPDGLIAEIVRDIFLYLED